MQARRLAVIVSLDVVGFSRLMQHNSAALVKALNTIFRSIVQPEVATHDGRVVKLLGDGAIVEFSSASQAISCAISIQQRLPSEQPIGYNHGPIELRVGLHAGDVIVEGDDLFGDALNIAARLQAEAEPGGVLLSKAVADLAGGSHASQLKREGNRRLKNIDTPIETLSVDLSGMQNSVQDVEVNKPLNVRFCRSRDGHSLAWASVGEGKPIVKAANWISHMELDWRNPGKAGIYKLLSGQWRYTYYDARGNGLSDWEMKDISFEAMVDDLEAVFDAAGIESAPVVGISQGSAIATAFAARAPERVSSIIMIAGYAQGREKRNSQADVQRAKAMQEMMRTSWYDDSPSLRDFLAELIVPTASKEDREQYADDMKRMISPENLARYRQVLDNIDVTALLPKVSVPCLVLHSNGDKMQPIEQGRTMAAGLPNSRFISLETRSHSIPEADPVWPQVEREILAFLEDY